MKQWLTVRLNKEGFDLDILEVDICRGNTVKRGNLCNVENQAWWLDRLEEFQRVIITTICFILKDNLV